MAYTYDSIQEMAESLHSVLKNSGHDLTPPYINEQNKEYIVSLLGGRLKYEDSMTADGVIAPTHDGFEIRLPNSMRQTAPIRDVFTIAHELGHLLIHMNYRGPGTIQYEYTDEMYRLGNSQQENEANHFAANFLMPEHQFRNYWQDVRGNIQAVADYFGVSQPAASTRAKFLGLLAW